MKKKLWIIVVAVLLTIAVGTTIAFADDQGEWRGFRRHEERITDLVEDGLLTQEQADSITAGDAHIDDFIDCDTLDEMRPEGGRGMHGEGMPEELLAKLVEHGPLTQEQADSIAAGDAHISDFIDKEDLEGLRPEGGRGMHGEGMPEELLAKLVEDGMLTQEQADSITAGDAHIDDFIDREDLPRRGDKGGKGGRGRMIRDTEE